jgi:aspartate racemase
LGGLGPRASAEFVQTIYSFARDRKEQDLPSVIMLSDPGYPDRSDAFMAGQTDELLARLTADLSLLAQAGAGMLIICCVTMHYLFDLLPADLRSKVFSLVDAAIEEIDTTNGKYLMLCSNGTRKLGVFEQRSKWARIGDRVILPSSADQNQIHKLIYAIKAGEAMGPSLNRLKTILDGYETRSIIAGCTEFHILVRYLKRSRTRDPQFHIIDPLTTAARFINEGALRVRKA